MTLQRLLWSLRRELWEHRAACLAPVVVAGLAIVALLVNARRLPRSVEALAKLDAAQQAHMALLPYGLAASAVLATTWLVVVFYSLEALHAERRDRSILFWKSMPVSDGVTVASKVLFALAVLPGFATIVALVLQAVMLGVAAGILSAAGLDPAAHLARVPIATMVVTLVYGVAVHSLWYAPSVAYLLLVSAWAKRAPFLWALVPFIAGMTLEKLAFGTSYVGAFLRERVAGAMALAFQGDDKQFTTTLSQLTPGTFLSSPALWIGLLAAAGMLACAVSVRRHREPT